MAGGGAYRDAGAAGQACLVADAGRLDQVPGSPFSGVPVGAASAAKLMQRQMAQRAEVSAPPASRLTPLLQAADVFAA